MGEGCDGRPRRRTGIRKDARASFKGVVVVWRRRDKCAGLCISKRVAVRRGAETRTIVLSQVVVVEEWANNGHRMHTVHVRREQIPGFIIIIIITLLIVNAVVWIVEETGDAAAPKSHT